MTLALIRPTKTDLHYWRMTLALIRPTKTDLHYWRMTLRLSALRKPI
jgi:hypothetical protein